MAKTKRKKPGAKKPGRKTVATEVAIIATSTLAAEEAVIERSRITCAEAGQALRKIRDEELYRKSFKSFERYCSDRWGYTADYARKLIAASSVVEVLKTDTIVSVLPATETQIRELVPLHGTANLTLVWRRIVKQADGDPDKITAKIVKAEVAKVLPPKAPRPPRAAPPPAPPPPETPTTIIEPDGTDYREVIAKQAANEFGATPQEAAGMADSMIELRTALETHGGPPLSDEPPTDVILLVAEDDATVFVKSVETFCRDLDQMVARGKEFKKSPFSHSIHVDSAVEQIAAARKTFWQGRPDCECPYCRANGEVKPACKACKGTSRVKKSTFDSGTKAVGGVA